MGMVLPVTAGCCGAASHLKVLTSSFSMELNVWGLPPSFQDTSPQLSLEVPLLRGPAHTHVCVQLSAPSRCTGTHGWEGRAGAAPALCRFSLCSRHTRRGCIEIPMAALRYLNSLPFRGLHPVAPGCSQPKGGDSTSL